MKPLWTPQPEYLQKSLIMQFMNQHGLKDFEALHAWSVEDMAAFWGAAWDFFGIVGDKGQAVVREIGHVPYARFFPDSKISYAENMLAYGVLHPDKPAIVARCQDGDDCVLSWKDLAAQVSLWQQALESLGVGEGDKVAVYLPNVPETVILLLAVSNIGAVFASAGMEMGASDLINRFRQIEPKVMISQSGYVHGAKTIDRMEIVKRVWNEIESIQTGILLGEDADSLLSRFKPQPLKFTRREFNHPLYILFSSGSTGQPKCFEHSSGGILLKHLSEYQFHCDVRKGDVVFYHATPSWMMWNWLASGLASGATILMYDGNPFYPDAAAQWNFTAAHGCTHHGNAAPVILGWEKEGLDLMGKDMPELRVVMSTGAVLPVQSYHYIHEHIKADVKISSISGGTDLVGCFLGGNPLAATYPGLTNGPMLGCDIRIWNDDGDELRSGQAGELVCVKPFPSMPLRFINDADRSRYEDAYFDFYQGKKVWRHGDTIERTAEGQYVIIGRSDATLNQNGVRIGPAVIYDQIEELGTGVADYAAVDFTRPDNKQAITVLFLVCENFNDELCGTIKKAVKDNVTPYAIPTEIIQVSSILKTPNGKKAEVVMKKILAGKEVPNASLYGEALVAEYQAIGLSLQKKYAEAA